MKKSFKYFLISAVAFLSFGSCTNLDEHIYSQIASENYEFTPKDMESMMAPVFNSMKIMFWNWDGMQDLLETCTDVYCTPARIGVGWGAQYAQLHVHDFAYTIGHFWNAWNNGYNGIRACNMFLDDPNITDPSLIAQLRAYRATYYYLLFDMFRNIPHDLAYVHPDGWLPEQATPQQTWDFIIGEFNAVKDQLNAYENSTMGMMSKYAVHMFLAKMYLNHNAWFNDHSDNSWYGKAIDEVNVVIDSGKFRLTGTYPENFMEDISTSPEIIFGLPLGRNRGAQGNGNYYASLFFNITNIPRWNYTTWSTGGGAGIPQFYDSYREGDNRKELTWTEGQQYSASGEPLMQTATEPLVYVNFLHSINHPGCYPLEGVRLVKYQIQGGPWATNYDDVPFLRYADALFIKAECLLRLGGYKDESEQVAADLVTQVRMRSFSDPALAVRTVEQLKGASVIDYGHREVQQEAIQGTDPIQMKDIPFETHEGGDDIELGGLFDDLGWEFAAEFHRRQDMIRFRLTSKDQNVFNGKSYFSKLALGAGDYHQNVFPIPKRAMDGNMKLVQNPGYELQ